MINPCSSVGRGKTVYFVLVCLKALKKTTTKHRGAFRIRQYDIFILICKNVPLEMFICCDQLWISLLDGFQDGGAANFTRRSSSATGWSKLLDALQRFTLTSSCGVLCHAAAGTLQLVHLHVILLRCRELFWVWGFFLRKDYATLLFFKFYFF